MHQVGGLPAFTPAPIGAPSGVTTPAILATRLTKVFRGTPAVDGLTLRVERGRFFGFLGPNGAGKSTTIRMIMNIYVPDSGSVRLFGNGADAKILVEFTGMWVGRQIKFKMTRIHRLSNCLALNVVRRVVVIVGKPGRSVGILGRRAAVDTVRTTDCRGSMGACLMNRQGAARRT